MTALSPAFYRTLKAAGLSEARKAFDADEVPVGAVVFDPVSERIIAAAYNRPIALKDPTAHAEILAIRKACEILSAKRLDGYSIYVTLQPCAMCLGALKEAHIANVFYAAPDLKTGDYAFKDVQKMTDDADEAQILKNFFQKKRTSSEEG